MSSSHAHGTDAQGDDDTIGHGSLRSYAVGFVLSVVLTAIPFWLVMADPLQNPVFTGVLVVAFAAAQILVHTFCFLHVNTRAEGGWSLVAYVFTGVILLITIAGSLWITYHLNSNMMPGMATGTSATMP